MILSYLSGNGATSLPVSLHRSFLLDAEKLDPEGGLEGVSHIQVRPVDQLSELLAGDVVALCEMWKDVLGEVHRPGHDEPSPRLVLDWLHPIRRLDQIDSCFSVQEEQPFQPCVIVILPLNLLDFL